MANKRELKIEILGDAKGVASAFQEAERETDGFGRKLGGFGKKAAIGMAGVGVAAVGAGVVLADFTQQAMDDQAEQAVFEKQLLLAGGSQAVIDAMNDQISAGMKLKGFTDTDLRAAYAQAYSQSGDMAQSTEDVALAMDIARKAGVPLEQAMDAVTKAQNGNMRGLKSLLPEYGGLIDSAGTSAEALDGVRDATRGMSDEWANTAQGKMERAKLQFGELKESIGTAFLPIVDAIAPKIQEGMEWIGERLPGAMATAKEWIDENWPAIRDVIMDVVTKVRDGISGFVTFIQEAWKDWGDEIMAVVSVVWPYIRDTVRNALEVVRGIIKTITSLITGDWSGVWDGIKQVLGGVWDQMVNLVKSGGGLLKLAVQFVWDGIKTAAGNAWDAIVELVKGIPERLISALLGLSTILTAPFRSAFNSVANLWNRTIGSLSFTVPDWVPGLGGKGWSVPDIPTLHSGGIVGGLPFSGLRSDEIPAILQRGEVVLTREQAGAVGDRMGGGGVVINMYGSNTSPHEVAREVAWQWRVA